MPSAYLIETQLLSLVVEYISIATPVYWALVERHYVLGQCACLVGEDVLNLTKLLVQGGRPGLCRGVIGQVVHLSVPVYQLGEEQADHLNKMQLNI